MTEYIPNPNLKEGDFGYISVCPTDAPGDAFNVLVEVLHISGRGRLANVVPVAGGGEMTWVASCLVRNKVET
jgi:hypothetical protein